MWAGGCGIDMFCTTDPASIPEIRSSVAAGSSAERQFRWRQRAIRRFTDEDSARTSGCSANGESQILFSERSPVGHGGIRCGDDSALHCGSPLQGKQSYDALFSGGAAVRELCACHVEYNNELLAQEAFVETLVDTSDGRRGRSQHRCRHRISPPVRRRRCQWRESTK
jgi:hypothetical protein